MRKLLIAFLFIAFATSGFPAGRIVAAAGPLVTAVSMADCDCPPDEGECDSAQAKGCATGADCAASCAFQQSMHNVPIGTFIDSFRPRVRSAVSTVSPPLTAGAPPFRPPRLSILA